MRLAVEKDAHRAVKERVANEDTILVAVVLLHNAPGRELFALCPCLAVALAIGRLKQLLHAGINGSLQGGPRKLGYSHRTCKEHLLLHSLHDFHSFCALRTRREVAIGVLMQLISIQSRAVGFIAIGAEAHGIFALGQVAYGVVAVGQMATGMIAIGQLARGWIAIGQGAIGLYALGQGAVGLFSATGMIAIGARARGLAWSVWPKTERSRAPNLSALSDLRAGREQNGWVKFTAKASNGKILVKIDGREQQDIELPPDAQTQVLMNNKRDGWLYLMREIQVTPDENANFRSAPDQRAVLTATQVQWKTLGGVSTGRWIVTALVMAAMAAAVTAASLVPAVRSIYSVFDESYQPE